MNLEFAKPLTIPELLHFCEHPEELDSLVKKTKELASSYVQEHGFTKNDAETHRAKTLHGKPFDQNRLGKLSDGSFVPGFEDFYIAASEAKLSKRTYDIMQAPLTPHGDKVDTVKDFWDTVVVLRRSPVIVTVHNPEEKIAKRGHCERAAYWASERFCPAMQLRNGWKLEIANEEVIAANEHFRAVKLVKRSFIATNSSTQETHEVTQFHYQGWPDHLGLPDHELFLKTAEAVDQEFARKKLAADRPITVHCAAGMGRSPTFCVAHDLMLSLQEQFEQKVAPEDIRVELVKSIFQVMVSRPSTLHGKKHWETILYALRRFYVQRACPEKLLDVKISEIVSEMKTLMQAAVNDENDRIKLMRR